MFFQRIDLKKFMLVSLAAHLVAGTLMTVFHFTQDKIVTIPLSFGNDPTKSAGGGEGSARGRYIPVSMTAPSKAKISTTSIMKEPMVSKSVKTDVTSVQQSAVVKPTVDSLNGTGSASGTGTGNGVGTGHGDGIGAGNGGGVNSIRAKYFTEIAKLIERNKKYPPLAKRMGQHGLVLVKLTLDKAGKILGVEVVDGAKFSSLREASIKAIESVSSFPGIPEEFGVDKISFSVPIKYQLE